MFNPDPKKEKSQNKVCKFLGCHNKIWSHGWCIIHKKYYSVKGKAKYPFKTLKKGKKEHSLSLVDQADILHSRYVKLLWGMQCYTCPYYGIQVECSHFVPRSCWALRWYINNTRVGCIHCNRELQGNLIVFEKKLRAELSSAEVDKMLTLKHSFNKKPSKEELIIIIEQLKQKINEIK